MGQWRRISRGKIVMGSVLVLAGFLVYIPHRTIATAMLEPVTARHTQALQELAQLRATTALERALIHRLERANDLFLETVAGFSRVIVVLLGSWPITLGSAFIVSGIADRRRLARLQSFAHLKEP